MAFHHRAQLHGDGVFAAAGADMPLRVRGLGVGLLCGLFNGILVTRFNLSSIVITIGTMSLYRGITYILLGDQALNSYRRASPGSGQGSGVRCRLSSRCLSCWPLCLPLCCTAPFWPPHLRHRQQPDRRVVLGINVKRHN